PELTAAALESYLLKFTEDTSRWPSNDEFAESWVSREAYRTVGPAGLRVIFDALERTARTGATEPLYFAGDLTIEHLLPQGWTEDAYPLPADLPEPDAKARRAHLIHT